MACSAGSSSGPTWVKKSGGEKTIEIGETFGQKVVYYGQPIPPKLASLLNNTCNHRWD
jgi:hypothetical protein